MNSPKSAEKLLWAIKRNRRSVRDGKEDDKMVSILKVKGMSCQHCVMSVTKALTQLEGIRNVQVDLAKGEVRFDNTRSMTSDQIQKVIEDAGYQVVQS
jgi:copper chaperone